MNQNTRVLLWEEEIIIPTYTLTEPDKNPMFLERRAYQGSSGKVYPLPVTDGLTDEKVDKVYRAVFLENDYLKIMILPELGGRIQRALDKTNNYDFVYYNQVIKPALVGLVGPWISGGIEFNWPQHHRPTTYEPLDYTFEERPDGRKTLWCGETDKMNGTRSVVGFTLSPESAYLEIHGRLSNPTDLPQTFLWWANPAVPVNDQTYSVFPTDVKAVMDHGKRAVSSFPIATGEYYKADYSAGVDISRYKNVPVPTSYMVHHSEYDFMGNYDEQKEAGLLHVADHHISPGKKQWTWGNSDFGKAWDRNLTDEDGPYIELMTGVFTDNQPDFTWLNPYEEKTFTQYFMPYKKVGRVKNATKEAALNWSFSEGTGKVILYTTAAHDDVILTISREGERLYEKELVSSPENPCTIEMKLPLVDDTGLSIDIISKKKGLLVAYEITEEAFEALPEAADALPLPEELGSPEELFLAGLHLEQYRHASYRPEDYYREGLTRFPKDMRLNDAYGLLLYRRGCFAESETYFRKAVERESWLTANPYTGIHHLHLGLSLFMQERYKEAYTTFYKSTWCEDSQSAAFYYLACLSCRKSSWQDASQFLERSLVYNSHNIKSLVLKGALGRILGEDNSDLLREASHIDRLNPGLLNEQRLSHSDSETGSAPLGRDENLYLDLALDYWRAGLISDGLEVLELYTPPSPRIFYMKAWFYERQGQEDLADKSLAQAESADSAYCFPSKLEEILILESAIRRNTKGSKAHYYLGNLLYDKKQYERAAQCWTHGLTLDPDFPTNYRNLSIYYFNKEGDRDRAMECISKAFELDPSDARLLFEYDNLAALCGRSVQERLKQLKAHEHLCLKRDDLCVEYVTLLNTAGKFEEAHAILTNRQFHPWEGGEGRSSAQYILCITELGRKALTEGNLKKAKEYMLKALEIPENLGEGKLPNAQDNVAEYFLGCIAERNGHREEAEMWWHRASTGLEEPSEMRYYNDQPSDTIFYQALAWEKLKDSGQARKRYHHLIRFGEQMSFKTIQPDYFAVSLPEITVYQQDEERQRDANCGYLRGLGYWGLGQNEKALEEMERVLMKRPDHQGIHIHRLRFT